MNEVMPKKTKFQEHLENIKNRKGTGSLLTLEDLTPSERSKIASEIFSLSSFLEDKYSAYIQVLSRNGIICPHPLNKRVYEGIKKSSKFLNDFKWYTCEMCGCGVINEHWVHSKKEEESVE